MPAAQVLASYAYTISSPNPLAKYASMSPKDGATMARQRQPGAFSILHGCVRFRLGYHHLEQVVAGHANLVQLVRVLLRDLRRGTTIDQMPFRPRNSWGLLQGKPTTDLMGSTQGGPIPKPDESKIV